MGTEHEAGWYPDPTGRHQHRFYDGTAWTDHVGDSGRQSTDPLEPAAPAAAGPGLFTQAAKKAAEIAKQKRADRADAKAAKVDEPEAPPTPTPAASASTADGAILTTTSHDEGRNAIVKVFPDRIERIKPRSRTSFSRAAQDAEVIPIRAISSVEAKKAGLRTAVIVYATGNEIVFRIPHADAVNFRDTLTRLMTQPSPPPATATPPSLADQLRDLARLRDEGLLTDAEFEAQKARLLS